VRVYSCEVRYRKPSGSIFQIAIREAKLQAAATMFVGDSILADIDGANRAGLISVLKDPAGRHARSRIRPRHTVARLSELPAIVAQYQLPSGQ
jgi:putative hydrolase of the HAD superfamily